ncbi:MAG: GlsB/YeaQ/YmgE family stress response membrane protein [Cyanosarcina radialis HA8281-LM2]|jgi:uncharacterized membrane protein YeaQ/YmgE (transglycosylase-associated protein family)|nr:GlsB/YeaQ/YmgE family stress response membrane protein [Cyanosarcina radialis HA8281-LM2]
MQLIGTILAWIIVGGLAGAIAKAIIPGRQGGGFWITVLLGIVGAFIGDTIWSSIKLRTLAINLSGPSLEGIILAIIGAIIATFLWSWITGRKSFD